MAGKKRDYKKEYEYHGQPEQIANRASRNAARAKMVEKHGETTMKGKDTSHVNNQPRDNRLDNLKPESPSKNRARKARKA